MNDALNDIIARETYGKSYKSCKYTLENSEENSNYDDESQIRIWKRSAESSQRKKYINLLPLSRNLSQSDEQILTYFLDGSRRIFKVDEIAYSHSGGRKVIYPVAAGQIGIGCCKRVNRRLMPERFMREIVIALPDIADPDGTPGFFPSVAHKMNQSMAMKRRGLEISHVMKYKTGGHDEEDKAKAVIQTRMLELEKEMTAQLSKRLNHKNYLIKDGSLEYRKQSQAALQNYRWVIGISKSFNPSACKNSQGKDDPGYIADLPVYHRTQAACFTNELVSDAKYAVWYIRLHDKSRTRSAFDGVIKAEKMLVTQSEREKGIMNSDEIDMLSAYILNERCPVCYGKDSRWPNHIYPVYLTESYIKSKYIGTENFLSMF